MNAVAIGASSGAKRQADVFGSCTTNNGNQRLSALIGMKNLAAISQSLVT
jgi:hypothetical protein